MGFVKTLTNRNGKKFQLYIETSNEGFHYLFALPEDFEEGKHMVVESFNSAGHSQRHYRDNIREALENGTAIDHLLIEGIEDAPIVLPIVPDLIHCSDCQQLSKESVENELMDIRFLHCIEEARGHIEAITGKRVAEKIFLNGYSASGVFAQRFALAHPEIIDRCLIGGAAGTIPIPSTELDYPIGIRDYEKLFAKPFDFQAYESIDFAYYVAENEEREAGSYDIEGARIESMSQVAAPMHDMSFRGPTTPYDVGMEQRIMLGHTMDERYKNAVQFYKDMGIKISAIILRGANHAGIFSDRMNPSAPYLRQQMLAFYRDGEPLKDDPINCVKQINPSFQAEREKFEKEESKEK